MLNTYIKANYRSMKWLLIWRNSLLEIDEYLLQMLLTDSYDIEDENIIAKK